MCVGTFFIALAGISICEVPFLSIHFLEKEGELQLCNYINIRAVSSLEGYHHYQIRNLVSSRKQFCKWQSKVFVPHLFLYCSCLVI